MFNGPLANVLMGAALLGTAFATTSADAQVINSGQPVVRDCDAAGVGLRDLVVGDDGGGIRSFYSGEVVLLAIDQVEPAAAASGVAIMADLRAGGEAIGGPPPFTRADRSRFLSSLDQILVKLCRNAKR